MQQSTMSEHILLSIKANNQPLRRQHSCIFSSMADSQRYKMLTLSLNYRLPYHFLDRHHLNIGGWQGACQQHRFGFGY